LTKKTIIAKIKIAKRDWGGVKWLGKVDKLTS
jgi:hypothetical protein